MAIINNNWLYQAQNGSSYQRADMIDYSRCLASFGPFAVGTFVTYRNSIYRIYVISESGTYYLDPVNPSQVRLTCDNQLELVKCETASLLYG